MHFQLPPFAIALLGVVLLVVGIVGGRVPLTILGAVLLVLAGVRFLLGSRG